MRWWPVFKVRRICLECRESTKDLFLGSCYSVLCECTETWTSNSAYMSSVHCLRTLLTFAGWMILPVVCLAPIDLESNCEAEQGHWEVYFTECVVDLVWTEEVEWLEYVEFCELRSWISGGVKCKQTTVRFFIRCGWRMYLTAHDIVNLYFSVLWAIKMKIASSYCSLIFHVFFPPVQLRVLSSPPTDSSVVLEPSQYAAPLVIPFNEKARRRNGGHWLPRRRLVLA